MTDEAQPTKRIQRGGLLEIVVQLRRLMTMCETSSYILYASFADLDDPLLESEAEKARHTLELATNRVASLLACIEKTPAFVELRQEMLARRTAGTVRSDDEE